MHRRVLFSWAVMNLPIRTRGRLRASPESSETTINRTAASGVAWGIVGGWLAFTAGLSNVSELGEPCQKRLFLSNRQKLANIGVISYEATQTTSVTFQPGPQFTN